jgi:hypothetical protein
VSDAVNAIIAEPSKAPIQSDTIETKESIGVGTTDGAAPSKDEKVSSRLEMLIRREQQAVARERIAKASEQESSRLRAELESERAKIARFNSIKTNPKLALEELGLTYDELTKAVLSDGELPPEVGLKKLQSEIDGLKQDRESEKVKYQESLKLQAQANEAKAVDDFKGEIKTYVSDNASRYELINFDGREDEVYELIDAHYTRTQKKHAEELELEGKDASQAIGKVMKIAEAADKIEEYYEKRELEKKKLAKIQTIWGAVPKESLAKAVSEARAQNMKPQSAKTLTNNSSAQNLKPTTTRPKNEDQRVADIVARFAATRAAKTI